MLPLPGVGAFPPPVPARAGATDTGSEDSSCLAATDPVDTCVEPMPFPAVRDNGDLDALLDVAPYRSMADGIASTLADFEKARARGIDLRALFLKTLEKNQ